MSLKSYEKWVLGKGLTSYKVNFNEEKAYSILTSPSLMGLMHSHGLHTMESPFFDAKFNNDVAIMGVIMFNFLIRVKATPNGEYRLEWSPNYRHNIFIPESQLKTGNNPFDQNTKGGHVESVIPSEYAFLMFNQEGKIDSNLSTLYQGTDEYGGYKYSDMNIVNISMSENGGAKHHFLSDKNIRHAFSEKATYDTTFTFEAHCVGLVSYCRADHNRMTDGKGRHLYPNPNPNTGYGYVHYFNVSAFHLGVKSVESSFFYHEGTQNVRRRAAKFVEKENPLPSPSLEGESFPHDLFEDEEDEENEEDTKSETSESLESSETPEETVKVNLEDTNVQKVAKEVTEENLSGDEDVEKFQVSYAQKALGKKRYNFVSSLELNSLYAFLLLFLHEVGDYSECYDSASDVYHRGSEISDFELLNNSLKDLGKKAKEKEEEVNNFFSAFSSLKEVEDYLENQLSDDEEEGWFGNSDDDDDDGNHDNDDDNDDDLSEGGSAPETNESESESELEDQDDDLEEEINLVRDFYSSLGFQENVSDAVKSATFAFLANEAGEGFFEKGTSFLKNGVDDSVTEVLTAVRTALKSSVMKKKCISDGIVSLKKANSLESFIKDYFSVDSSDSSEGSNSDFGGIPEAKTGFPDNLSNVLEVAEEEQQKGNVQDPLGEQEEQQQEEEEETGAYNPDQGPQSDVSGLDNLFG